MADLTPEQIREVQKVQASVERPTYYSAILRQDIQISEDFEAFAILVEPDLREEIIDRLGQANEGDPVRRRLYEEAISFEQQDAQERLLVLERQVAGFGAFRQNVIASPAGSSPDIAPLIQDVQRNIGIVAEDRERMYHRLQVARVLESLNTRQEGGDNIQKQRDSWEEVLSTYR